MKKHYLLLLFLSFEVTFTHIQAQSARLTFDDESNLLKATVGSDLLFIGSHSLVEGSTLVNRGISISRWSYYKVKHAITPNGGDSYVNEYSIVIDIRILNAQDWKAIFNANTYSANPSECFILPEGKIRAGATGYANYSMKVEDWHRLVISIDLGTHVRYYLDGKLMKEGNMQPVNGTFTLDPEHLFFADSKGEDETLELVELPIYSKTLSKSEVVKLSGYGHNIMEDEVTVNSSFPYLQSPTSNATTISFYGSTVSYQIAYGTTKQAYYYASIVNDDSHILFHVGGTFYIKGAADRLFVSDVPNKILMSKFLQKGEHKIPFTFQPSLYLAMIGGITHKLFINH